MIKGEKIDLVSISMEYLPYYLKWINDPYVSDMLGDSRFPISKDNERQWIESQLSPSAESRIFTILTKKGEPIGNVGFNKINYVTRHAVIGIMIGETRFWDKGYGTDAMRTLIRFGFEELGMVKMELGVHAVNARAITCYKKCGFVVEGRQRKHDFYRGEYRDSLNMGILREEWAMVKGKKPTRRSSA